MPDLADDLNNLVMDPAAQPLLDAVKTVSYTHLRAHET